MRFDLRYSGKSGLRDIPGGQALAFAPNLSRDKVFFDGALKHPLRFREAMSALYEVVVGDLKAKKKDRAGYESYKAEEQRKQKELGEVLLSKAKQDEIAKITKEPIPPDLSAQFHKMHGIYWKARVQWANELARNDPALFRALVPCDPVVTVAPDVVAFECFAKDESSYGCVTVQRDAFDGGDSQLGTTNVDYSLALFDHFQALRTYRETRLLVDPAGFEVQTKTTHDLAIREEKIDLPSSWLRGFGQLQAAMTLPARSIDLSVDVVYSILAHLKRHRERTGPRSLRFSLVPGRAPQITLDPWGIVITSHGAPYAGDKPEEIKVWGRRRLFALARLLPLAEKFSVRLLGNGLPSVWTAHMGEMRFVLALSGWTANDWTAGANLEQIFAPRPEDAVVTERITRHLEKERSATVDSLATVARSDAETIHASLRALAKRGQVMFDFAVGVYRFRPIMPSVLSEAIIGPEPPEVEAGKRLAREVTIERILPLDRGRRAITAKVQNTSCEGILDIDGQFGRAKCSCSFFYKSRLRMGPCRHLMALRMAVMDLAPPVSGAGDASASTTSSASSSAKARGAPRVSHAIYLPRAALDEIRAEAQKRGVQISSIVESAWLIARSQIQSARDPDALFVAHGIGERDKGTANAPNATGAFTTDRMKVDLEIAEAVLREVQEIAERCEKSASHVITLAWALAKGPMSLTSSLLS